MASYCLHLQPLPFERVVSGLKKIELRLFRDRYAEFQVGDTIEFHNDAQETVRVQITEILRYPTFVELFSDVGVATCGAPELTGEEYAKRLLSTFYTPEQEKEYGVVGFRIELVA